MAYQNKIEKYVNFNSAKNIHWVIKKKQQIRSDLKIKVINFGKRTPFLKISNCGRKYICIYVYDIHTLELNKSFYKVAGDVI